MEKGTNKSYKVSINPVSPNSINIKSHQACNTWRSKPAVAQQAFARSLASSCAGFITFDISIRYSCTTLPQYYLYIDFYNLKLHIVLFQKFISHFNFSWAGRQGGSGNSRQGEIIKIYFRKRVKWLFKRKRNGHPKTRNPWCPQTHLTREEPLHAILYVYMLVYTYYYMYIY